MFEQQHPPVVFFILVSVEFPCSGCTPAPSNVEVAFPSENCGNSVLVMWNTPSGEEVDSFTIVCVGDGTVSTEAKVSGDFTEAIVGPLDTSGIEYTCSVSAQNKFGSSQAASSNVFVTG